jgi:hypothetical protein
MCRSGSARPIAMARFPMAISIGSKSNEYRCPAGHALRSDRRWLKEPRSHIAKADTIIYRSSQTTLSRQCRVGDDLHRVTDIAKPTLVRIVETWQDAGYLNAGNAERRYAVTPRVLSPASGYEEQRWLMEVTLPLLDEFRSLTGWPVELGVFDTDAMVI